MKRTGILCLMIKQIIVFMMKDLKKKIKIGYSKFWGMEKYFDTNLMEKEVVNKIETLFLYCLKMAPY